MENKTTLTMKNVKLHERQGWNLELLRSDPEEFQGLCCEIFEGFLESMQNDKRFVVPVNEYDGAIDESWQFVYTDRGMRLGERMRDRLAKVCEAMFPEEEFFTIESHLLQEL